MLKAKWAQRFAGADLVRKMVAAAMLFHQFYVHHSLASLAKSEAHLGTTSSLRRRHFIGMSFTIPQRADLQTRTAEAPHPSAGGRGDGYSQDIRTMVMAIRHTGDSNNPIFDALRAQRLYPSIDSEKRWAELENVHGHFRQCRRTGNAFATVLRDYNLLLLALYRITFPKATSAEINAFLYRANYGDLTFRFSRHRRYQRTRRVLDLRGNGVVQPLIKLSCR